jgi:hypothetical protein|tara:strand:- start:1746 stop:1991 length:246 start_codon:yes stop_codon:yes gene_type:complete
MINNNKDNVINFTSLKGVRDKKNTNEYKVCLFENKKYEFTIEADSGESAEDIISDKYEQGVLDLNNFESFTYETIAESIEK